MLLPHQPSLTETRVHLDLRLGWESKSSSRLLFLLTPLARQLPLVFLLQPFESTVQPVIHERARN